MLTKTEDNKHHKHVTTFKQTRLGASMAMSISTLTDCVDNNYKTKSIKCKKVENAVFAQMGS